MFAVKLERRSCLGGSTARGGEQALLEFSGLEDEYRKASSTNGTTIRRGDLAALGGESRHRARTRRRRCRGKTVGQKWDDDAVIMAGSPFLPLHPLPSRRALSRTRHPVDAKSMPVPGRVRAKNVPGPRYNPDCRCRSRWPSETAVEKNITDDIAQVFAEQRLANSKDAS